MSYAPRDETVLVNRTTFLPCEVSFNPQLDLTYTWYQNDFLIEFEKVRTIGMNVYIEKDPYFHRVSTEQLADSLLLSRAADTWPRLSAVSSSS